MENKSRYHRLKYQTFTILEKAPDGNRIAYFIDILIVAMILLSVVSVILDTVSEFENNFKESLWFFEIITVAFFSIEYLLRLWVCTCKPKYSKPFSGRIRYAITPLALVDLVSVLPFFLQAFTQLDLRFVRSLRLMRLARLLKLGRYSDALSTLSNVFKSKREELVMSAMIIIIAIVVTSSLLFIVEKEAQPEAFSSIPASMWWSVETMTTVGYGDIAPVTPTGKALSGIISLVGIALVAMPTAIIGSGFIEEFQRKRNKNICPHCKRDITSPADVEQTIPPTEIQS